MKDEKPRIADVYVTKWWQAKGILLVHGARVHDAEDSVRRMASWGVWGTYAHRNEFHFTYDEACAEVEKLGKAKLAALAREVAKVKKIRAAAAGRTLASREWSERSL